MQTSPPSLVPRADLAPAASVSASRFTAAYRRRLPEILAVKDEDLLALNLEVESVVTTVLGVLPKVEALRAEMARQPALDHALLGALEDYAAATAEAQTLYRTAQAPHDDLPALYAAALTQRDLFRADARALVKRGLIDPSRLHSFDGRIGYENVGFELLRWTALLLDVWPDIAGKTALTLDELHRAHHLGGELVRIAAEKRHAPARLSEADRIRRQAFTLLVTAYEELRRAVQFLRYRERDADEIAPSLYRRRHLRRKKRQSDEETVAAGAQSAASAANTKPAASPLSPANARGATPPAGTNEPERESKQRTKATASAHAPARTHAPASANEPERANPEPTAATNPDSVADAARPFAPARRWLQEPAWSSPQHEPALRAATRAPRLEALGSAGA